MAAPPPKRLLGFLAAKRAEVFRQAVVPATLSLGWVLQHKGAAAAVAKLVGAPEALVWEAEARNLVETGRPDLVGSDTRKRGR